MREHKDISTADILNSMDFRDKIECIETLSVYGYKINIAGGAGIDENRFEWRINKSNWDSPINQCDERFRSIEKTFIDMLYTMIDMIKIDEPDLYLRIKSKYYDSLRRG